MGSTVMVSPSLSVITVCKNEVQRIQQTADSILSQGDSFKFEWIVIDGGSTDGTLDLLDTYRSQIAIFHTGPDEGIYHAMNDGVKLASGEYVLFLNGGDFFASSADIGKVLRVATGDVVVCNIEVRYPQEERNQIRDYRTVDLGKDYLYWRPFPHSSTLFRRKLFEQYGLHDINFRIAADWEFMCRVVLRYGAEVQHVPVLLSIFYNDGISQDERFVKISRRERSRIRNMYFSLGYRQRREFNECWGRIQTRLRGFKRVIRI